MPTFSDQNTFVNEFDRPNHEFTDPSFFPSNPNLPPRDDSSETLGLTSEGEFYSPSTSTLQYISETLMEEEEELENRPCMLQDCLALRAAEKSLQDVLEQQSPSSSNHLLADDFINHSSSNSSTAATSYWDPDGSGWISFQNVGESSPLDTPNPISSNGKGAIIDVEGESPFLLDSTNGSRSKKNRHWEDGNYIDEGRSNKQSAVYTDESETPEMLDMVLLCHYQNPTCSSLQESDQLKGRSGLRGSKGKKKKQEKTGWQ